MKERSLKNRQLWEQRMADYESSGKTVEEWCNETGYSMGAFKYWRYRKNIKSSNHENLPMQQNGWVQLNVMNPEQAPTIAIKIGSVQIDVASGFDQGLLRQIVQALS